MKKKIEYYEEKKYFNGFQKYVVIENYFGRKNDCYMSNIRVI